jgi:hypothetical protein
MKRVETTVTRSGRSVLNGHPSFSPPLEQTIAWFERRIKHLQERNARLEDDRRSWRLLSLALLVLLFVLALVDILRMTS